MSDETTTAADAYVPRMSEQDDDVAQALRLLRGLAEVGVEPMSVKVGEVAFTVSRVVRPASEDDEAGHDEGGERGYVRRALSARKVG